MYELGGGSVYFLEAICLRYSDAELLDNPAEGALDSVPVRLFQTTKKRLMFFQRSPSRLQGAVGMFCDPHGRAGAKSPDDQTLDKKTPQSARFRLLESPNETLSYFVANLDPLVIGIAFPARNWEEDAWMQRL